MKPDVLDPIPLTRNLCPGQFGIYEVTVDRDTEPNLFDRLVEELETSTGKRVWKIHIVKAILKLDYQTAAEFHSTLGDVPVVFTCTSNLFTEPRDVLLHTPTEFIVGLAPVLP